VLIFSHNFQSLQLINHFSFYFLLPITWEWVGFKYKDYKFLLKTKPEKKMIDITSICNDYVGPRAIFDPNFIPPQIFFRKNEQNSLYSILNDSIADEFSLNILYQGIQGIGKKVIVNRVLEDLSIRNEDFKSFQKFNIDCKEKSFEDLVFSLLVEFNRLPDFNFKLDPILNSSFSQLWSILKLASRKLNSNLVLVFNNIEYVDPGCFKKILHLGKEMKITIISTVNRILRTSTLELLSSFDLKNKLNYFSYKELNHILEQRSHLTFVNGIESETIEFISDLIFEHYVPVPGKGIAILRDLYPFLIDKKLIDHYKILEICQQQFDSFQLSDEFNIFNYIAEEDLLMTIFLDNLSNYFLKTSNYYISSTELKEIYDISCETLDYEKNSNEFVNLIAKIQRIGLLNSSRKTIKDKSIRFKNFLECEYYFMNINPSHLKTIVDTIFGNI